MEFEIPSTATFWKRQEGDKKFATLGNISWFTNLLVHKADNPMELTEKYDPKKHLKYDNYDAINCDKIVDIPYDYDGVIGVPITITGLIADDGYIHFTRNDEEIKFSTVELGNSRDNFTPIKDYINPKKHMSNGDVKNGNAINCVLAINYTKIPNVFPYYTSDNSDYLVAPYARVLIKKN